jgi:hypothetical protein
MSRDKLHVKGCFGHRKKDAHPLARKARLTDTRHNLLGVGLPIRPGKVGMTARLKEKRKDYRVRSALPVSVNKASGVTRDMSASGAYFWVSGTYAIGDSISFSIGLDPDKSRIEWKCEGTVVRVEPRGNVIGVAVKITRTAVEPIRRDEMVSGEAS